MRVNHLHPRIVNIARPKGQNHITEEKQINDVISYCELL